jgi:hypothetical protein
MYPDFTEAPPHHRTHFLPILIHELCHVWQHQHPEIHGYSIRALYEHARHGHAVYRYDIHAHDRLCDFRIEQQGQIMQDYALHQLDGTPAPDHERVIRADICLESGKRPEHDELR